MFYTYLWLRGDGTPYYVGKGKGDRGLTSKDHRHSCPPKDRIIIQNHISEEEAYEAEKFIVDFYGRIDLGTGCLRNLTEGGDKPPSNKGKKHSEYTKRKMSIAAKGVIKRPAGYKHSEVTRYKMRHKHKIRIRTHCKRGHERTLENMRTNGRSCAPCELITQRLRRLKEK